MKMILALLLAAALPALAENTNKVDEQLEDKFAQAVVLARAGLYDEADAICQQILVQKPDQPTIKQLQREIEEMRQRRQAQDPGYTLRHKLEQMLVPEIHFREAAPGDIIDYLTAQSKELSPDKTALNFVWMVPADVPVKPVTLNLKKVPLADVLDYVTQLAGLKYRVEAHAVVIYKPETEKPIPPATEPNAKSK